MSGNISHTVDVSVSPENVPRFLDYLAVTLSKYRHQGSEGEYLPDGSFKENYRCLLPVSQDQEVITIWTLTLDARGRLLPIEVTIKDEIATDWSIRVEELVRSTLVDMVNGRKGKFFQRHLFAYLGHPLDGEYYIHGFRIAPSQPTNSFPFGFGEQVMILDINSEGINKSHALAIGKNEAIRISSLVSLFLNVGIYQIPMESRWFYEGEGCKSAQLGYRTSLPIPDVMPSKGTECKAGQPYDVNRFVGEDNYGRNAELRCPRDIRLLFRTFNSLPTIEKKMFEGAAALFQIAMTAGRNYPTVHIAYCVAAVDSLTRSHSANEFVELVSRLNSELDGADVRRFYEKYRSAHFHAGALPGGETESIDMTSLMLVRQRDQLSKQAVPRFVHTHMRTVILRWLIEHSAEN